MNETKKCPKCGETKPLSEFYKDKKKKDGHTLWCAYCMRQYSSKHRIEHIEHYKQYNKQYRKKNLQKCIDLSRRWRKEHREYCLEKKRIWREKHPEYRREYYLAHIDKIKKWRKEYNKLHKEHINKVKSIYKKNHLETAKKSHKKYRESEKGRESAIRVSYKRRAILKNCINDLTAEQWEQIKKSQNYTCLHCGKQEPEIKLTRDHIIPVSKGGHHTASNIQGLCGQCNSRKGDRNKCP